MTLAIVAIQLLTLALAFTIGRWAGYARGFAVGRTGVEGDLSLRARCRAVFERVPAWSIEAAKGEQLDALATLYGVTRKRPPC